MDLFYHLLGWGLVALGITHVAATLHFVPELGLPGLWFASAGGALILVGQLNLLELRYGRVAAGLFPICLLANLVTLVFAMVLARMTHATVAEFPQVFILLLLSSGASILALIRRASVKERWTA